MKNKTVLITGCSSGFGRGLVKLDALVNNAGYGLFGVFEELSEDLIRKQMEVNFFGCVLLTQALLPSIRATRGVILNLSSMLGFFAPPMSSLYCASKFAIEGWSESLHFELAPHGVRVVLIEPGSFNTQFGSNLMQYSICFHFFSEQVVCFF